MIRQHRSRWLLFVLSLMWLAGCGATATPTSPPVTATAVSALPIDRLPTPALPATIAPTATLPPEQAPTASFGDSNAGYDRTTHPGR